jgi:hypothetical protein
MNRVKRIATRGWLRRAITIATFGYFPLVDGAPHVDWCITSVATVTDWTTSAATVTDWATSAASVTDWATSAATITNWSTSMATVVNWSLSVEVICCGC